MHGWGTPHPVTAADVCLTRHRVEGVTNEGAEVRFDIDGVMVLADGLVNRLEYFPTDGSAEARFEELCRR